MMLPRRGFSTLAQKLREAAAGELKLGQKTAVAEPKDDLMDEKGESYREVFVMPKRKLQAQLTVERMTGRAVVEQRSRSDLHDRLSVRTPREKEMRDDQDWPSVWPAARSFNASVVPLPIRMGSRHYPEKRAPFKKEGNLELVKIPNFLHLTPAAIERHCEAIQKFCTPFPPEFEAKPEEAAAQVPLTIKYADYVHQGTNIRDNRSRIVTIQLKVAAFNLTKEAREKMVRLAGNRYDEATDTLSITTDRCYTRAQNYDYAHYLLTVLYHEANKVEAWEAMKERADDLKLQFEGSECKERLEKLLPADAKEKMAEFGVIWEKYMNTEETEETAREYAAKMKELILLSVKNAQQPAAAT